MITILVHPGPFEHAFQQAKKGAVFFLSLDGLRWPLEVRQTPRRVRLLEDGKWRSAPVLCELMDPWPDAPAYYPPQWAPGASPSLFGPRPIPE